MQHPLGHGHRSIAETGSIPHQKATLYPHFLCLRKIKTAIVSRIENWTQGKMKLKVDTEIEIENETKVKIELGVRLETKAGPRRDQKQYRDSNC
ncbi:hypothetical protein EVAR_12931_1 [Eumeta japonica]|uniref:Uncharacterized protein n=1 Tax=Eumeta variegata TaxID=151549 RepID=A0A4C1TW56_EUMVA|nr:hypothetical protein EVAR_12931_1 [Eumeta japonica]